MSADDTERLVEQIAPTQDQGEEWGLQLLGASTYTDPDDRERSFEPIVRAIFTAGARAVMPILEAAREEAVKAALGERRESVSTYEVEDIPGPRALLRVSRDGHTFTYYVPKKPLDLPAALADTGGEAK